MTKAARPMRNRKAIEEARNMFWRMSGQYTEHEAAKMQAYVDTLNWVLREDRPMRSAGRSDFSISADPFSPPPTEADLVRKEVERIVSSWLAFDPTVLNMAVNDVRIQDALKRAAPAEPQTEFRSVSEPKEGQ